MTIATATEDGAKYGGDFRIGSNSYFPTIVFNGDSRVYALKGDGVHQYQDYLTLPTYQGQNIALINRAWPSNSIHALFNDDNIVGAAQQVNDAYAFNGAFNIELIGPIGVNDMVQLGRSIAQIQADTVAYCQKKRAMGVLIGYIPEISSQTIGTGSSAGITGDTLKNCMWAWSTAIDTSGPNAGNPHWKSFADFFVPICAYPPFGQDTTINCGSANSAIYADDRVHIIDAGQRELASIVQPTLIAFINSLVLANYSKPDLPSMLNMLNRIIKLESILV